MKNEIKAVIFDMDGVIIDSEEIHVRSEKALYEKYNLKIEKEDWNYVKGRNAQDSHSYILQKNNRKDLNVADLISENIKIYQEMAKNNIKLFSGFKELINFVNKNFKLALTTSSNKLNQQFAFNIFNLHNFFDIVVTGDMVTCGKPHPEPYQKTIAKLNVPASQCIVIEDTANGVMSARAAGAKTIAVTHTFPTHKLEMADFVVNNLHTVKSLFVYETIQNTNY